MSSVNKAIILGRLGQDPEVRTTNSGQAVCTLSIATSERYLDKQGQRQERTEWHRVVCWGKTAELAAQYLKKGDPAYFEGRIQTREYTDKDGATRKATEIVASEMKFMGGGQGAGQPAAPSGGGAYGQTQQRGLPAGGRPAPTSDFDDDIPF